MKSFAPMATIVQHLPRFSLDATSDKLSLIFIACEAAKMSAGACASLQ